MSERSITRDVLDQLLATCERGRAINRRDRALLLLAWGSGDRRRSEIVRLTHNCDIVETGNESWRFKNRA